MRTDAKVFLLRALSVALLLLTAACVGHALLAPQRLGYLLLCLPLVMMVSLVDLELQRVRGRRRPVPARWSDVAPSG